MGCGASKDAKGARVLVDESPEERHPAPQSQKSYHANGNSSAIVELGAAIIVGEAAGAAMTTAGAVLSQTEHFSAAGEALLAVGAQLPWIAPAAYLIGAVVKAAHEVAVLKADAQSFVRVLESVEAILNQAAANGTLRNAQDVVAQVREVMEDALAHCNKVKPLGFEPTQPKLHKLQSPPLPTPVGMSLAELVRIPLVTAR